MSIGMLLCLVALAQTTSCLWFDAALSSYAKYKAWTTPSLGDLVFYFKTDKPNGLLLYKDEKNFEFLDVSLTDGRVRLRLAMFECSRRKALVEGNFADSKWHRVTIGFNNEKTTITVDETRSVFINCSKDAPEGFTKLIGAMFLGGLPKEIDLQGLAFPSSFYEFYRAEKRFNGCISGVRYTEEPGGTFRKAKLNMSRGTESGCTDPCSKCDRNGKCIYRQKTFRCNCGGTGYEEPFCRQESPSLEMSGSSYLLFNMTKDVQDLSFRSRYLAVRLRTRSPDGLVLQTGLRNRKQKDFLMMELEGGSILVKMDHGGGEIMLTGGQGSLHDDSWHWIEVQRNKLNVSLIIDNKIAATKVPGKFNRLDFYKEKAEMYIGGGPKEELAKSVSKKNFSGILQQFRFDKIKVIVRAQSDNHSVFRNFGAVIVANLPTTSTQLVTRPVSSPQRNVSISGKESTSVPSTQSVKIKPTREQLPKQIVTETDGSPIGPISLVVIVTAVTAAVLVTLFLVLRWHRRYAGSYTPEQRTQTQEVSFENRKDPKQDVEV